MMPVNSLIACCGLECEKCEARLATLTDDQSLREKVADLWSTLNGVTITPEMISCTGCRTEGAKTPFCESLCAIRRCALEKTLQTCADCAQMNCCPTLRKLTDGNPSALKNLQQLRGIGTPKEDAAQGTESGKESKRTYENPRTKRKSEGRKK